MQMVSTFALLVPAAAEVEDPNPLLLHVRGSGELQIDELAHVAPAWQDGEVLRGLTIALNCCLTAASQPAQALFKHESIVSKTAQVSLPDAVRAPARYA